MSLMKFIFSLTFASLSLSSFATAQPLNNSFDLDTQLEPMMEEASLAADKLFDELGESFEYSLKAVEKQRVETETPEVLKTITVETVNKNTEKDPLAETTATLNQEVPLLTETVLEEESINWFGKIWITIKGWFGVR